MSRRYRRASELGEWVFCQRAWWLHQVQGMEPGNAAARAQGDAAHAAYGTALQRAGWLRRMALGLLALAAGLLMLGWWLG